MRKENKHPNQQNREKKYSNKTPDSLSSRGTFKPKFIVKETNEQKIDDFPKSPNTVILDDILSSNSPLYSSKITGDWK